MADLLGTAGTSSTPAPRVTGLTAGLLGVGLAGGWAADNLPRAVPAAGTPTALGLLLVLAVAGYLHVEFHRNDDVVALDLFEAAVVPVLFVFPGVMAVLLVAAGKALAEALLRVDPLKAAFNVAQWAAAAGLGALTFSLAVRGLGRSPTDLVALVPAVFVVALVNHVAMVLVSRATGGGSLRSLATWLPPHLTTAWLVGLATTVVFGLLFAAAATWAPATTPLFVVPLAFLHWASRGWAASRTDLRHLRGLQRATHVLASTVQQGDVIPNFLEEVRNAFGAEAVELVVGEGAGPHDELSDTVHRVAQDDDGSPRASTAPPTDLHRALSGDRPMSVAVDRGDPRWTDLLERHGWRACLAAPLTAGDAHGWLCVYDPSGLGGSRETDLAVLSALAREAATALERHRLIDAVVRSEARFRALVRHSVDLTVVTDERGTILDRVPTRHPFALPEDVGVGSDLATIVHPDDVAALAAARTGLLGRPSAVETVECRLCAADGSWRDVELIITNLLDDPSVRGITHTGRDMTEHRRAGALLTCQTEILHAIARGTSLPDVVERLVDMVRSQAAASRISVLMRDDEGALRATAGQPLPPLAVDQVTRRLQPDGDGDADMRSEALYVDDDGSWYGGTAGEGTGRRLRALCAVHVGDGDGHRDGVLVLSFDQPRRPTADEWRLLALAARLLHVTFERFGTQERLVQQATRDPLTGLPNRLVFLDRAEVAISRLDRSQLGVAVIFVDLDRFKVINDSLGHDAGDRLLQTVGQRLSDAIRTNDTIARFGGDEFTVLCDDITDEAELRAIADRIREVVATPLQLDGHEVSVSASLGIAYTADAGTDATALIDDADSAMYRAKARGGNRSEAFDPALRRRALRELVTQSALRASIEHGDLRVHYQPIVSLDSGCVVGVEALVRWEHPELGLVPPVDFIPLAEQTGLIIPLGAFVLREACEQARRWAKESPVPITTSINLSARQFTDPHLPDAVAETLATTGVDPATIILEITETVLMENVDITGTALHGLRQLGVNLRIDDFGTGYSSLSYLKRFPVDGLKIDRSFVSGLDVDADDSTIVQAVVGLAHSLGMRAVAEGVETRGQRERLRALGCDTAQGYYFSRPVPADQVCLERVFP